VALRSEGADAAPAFDEKDLVDHLGTCIGAMRRLAGGEVERALSVVFYYLAVIFVEAADVPQRAEAESPCEPGLAETR
jgi:hypothetical protein